MFQPVTGHALLQGIRTITAAVRPTLGPPSFMVAIARHQSDRSPEILDDAGTIARRIIAIGDPDADMGAMLARHLLWRVRERAGDGAAAAAVILEALVNEGMRYLAAGGNAMSFRRYLNEGAQRISAELAPMAAPLEGQARLTSFARSVCADAELAGLMGEIFDIIGEYGRLEVRTAQGRRTDREYVEGMYWDSSPLHRGMVMRDQKARVDLEEPAILISNLEIDGARELLPVLTAAVEAGVRTLLLIVGGASTDALALLMANNDPPKLQIVAMKAPGVGPAQEGALEDLALLTGGRALRRETGDTLAGFRPDDFGHARRAWATHEFFGVIGSRGDPRALRRHVALLRDRYRQTKDREDRGRLRQRLGQLMGGSATLWLGATTETETEVRKALAERTAEALRGAILEGVVPGGGAALLACRPALQERARASQDPDERAAYRALMVALAAPMRTIIANAGGDPAAAMAEVERAGTGAGFDAVSGKVVDMAQAGILDAASVVREAWLGAVSTAAMALTVDVLIHRVKPEGAIEP